MKPVSVNLCVLIIKILGYCQPFLNQYTYVEDSQYCDYLFNIGIAVKKGLIELYVDIHRYQPVNHSRTKLPN